MKAYRAYMDAYHNAWAWGMSERECIAAAEDAEIAYQIEEAKLDKLYEEEYYKGMEEEYYRGMAEKYFENAMKLGM